MTAVKEPTPKKPFKKAPVKYHYRLGPEKLAAGLAAGGQGKVLAVLSATAYKTARDVANELRIEPHVAQGLLQRLLSRNAVERRIIPGCVHDVSSNSASAGFDERIIAGSIVRGRLSGSSYLVTARHPLYIDIYDNESAMSVRGTEAANYIYVGQTPNPIAFNRREYAKCFAAPEAPKTVNEAISEKVDEANTKALHFEVGDRIRGPVGYEYDVIGIDPALRLVALNESGMFLGTFGFSVFADYKVVGKTPAKPKPMPRTELIPLDVVSEVSRVFGVGADKYARDDWANEDNGGGDHIEAALRHINAYQRGERCEVGEKGSGLPHIDHAIARLMMMRGRELRNA